MKFYGFQKLTLLDYPGRTACTVFTGGCNFRCPFCHNALLVTELDPTAVWEEDEILAYLKKREGLLDGICVTGGEPLLHPELAGFLRRVRSMGYAVKLDTNGSLPDRLASVVEAGLVDMVAMDIKNCRERYAETIGVPGYRIAPIEESIRYLMAGHTEYEFRTTVVREFHRVEDIAEAARWIAGAPRYFLQSFTDSGNLIGKDCHAQPREVMEQMRQAASVYVPSVRLRGV